MVRHQAREALVFATFHLSYLGVVFIGEVLVNVAIARAGGGIYGTLPLLETAGRDLGSVWGEEGSARRRWKMAKRPVRLTPLVAHSPVSLGGVGDGRLIEDDGGGGLRGDVLLLVHTDGGNDAMLQD